jgi:hypothetical protein
MIAVREDAMKLDGIVSLLKTFRPAVRSRSQWSIYCCLVVILYLPQAQRRQEGGN